MMFAHPPLGVFKYHQKDLNFICNCVKQLDYKIVFDNPHHAKISKDVHVVESKSLRNFKKFLLASVHKYAEDVMLTRSKFRITNSWVNRSKYASGHPTHFHENSVLSGVFFVQSDETCPPITFESPMNNWQINPRKGDEGRTSTNEFNNFTYRSLLSSTLIMLISLAVYFDFNSISSVSILSKI